MNIKIFDEELKRFISLLQKEITAKALRTIDLLELFGNGLGMPHSKKVAPKLFELRIRGAQEVRILYVFHKNEAVLLPSLMLRQKRHHCVLTLLHGFIKKTDKISQREIETALKKKQRLDRA